MFLHIRQNYAYQKHTCITIPLCMCIENQIRLADTYAKLEVSFRQVEVKLLTMTFASIILNYPFASLLIHRIGRHAVH
jgi:hypothetical protein